jgi:hypothetical protein
VGAWDVLSRIEFGMGEFSIFKKFNYWKGKIQGTKVA